MDKLICYRCQQPWVGGGCGCPDGCCVILGDCREALPLLPKGAADVVLADPPYGIGKAEWDSGFPLWWLDDAARIAPLIAVMPGNWNLMRLPESIGEARYKWTLVAHLSNGMTRGGFGFGNWIPCVVYKRETPKPEIHQWCRELNQWLKARRIPQTKLDEICGTSSMGDWWASPHPVRCQIPTPAQWSKIKLNLSPPANFDELVNIFEDEYEPTGDCKDFTVGREPMPNHPSPKPLAVITWFLECLKGQTVLDPFLGSGTTAVACKMLGRRCIGIELSEDYVKIACKRLDATTPPLPVFAEAKPAQVSLL